MWFGREPPSVQIPDFIQQLSDPNARRRGLDAMELTKLNVDMSIKRQIESQPSPSIEFLPAQLVEDERVRLAKQARIDELRCIATAAARAKEQKKQAEIAAGTYVEPK